VRSPFLFALYVGWPGIDVEQARSRFAAWVIQGVAALNLGEKTKQALLGAKNREGLSALQQAELKGSAAIVKADDLIQAHLLDDVRPLSSN
jgi:hypothetical protein